MDALDLCYMPATELAAAIRTKAVSPVEVVTAILARIELLEPKLNAFATLTPERTLDAARFAEKAVMAGDTLGELHGIPVTHQGPDADGGDPDPTRVQDFRRRHTGNRRTGCHPHQTSRRDHIGEDDYPGVWLERGQPKPAHGRHFEPVAPRLQCRRFISRRRCRRCGRLRTTSSRLRWCRFDPYAVTFLRRLRTETNLWSHSESADPQQRPDITHRSPLLVPWPMQLCSSR